MLQALATRVDLITLENEFVDARGLADLERSGVLVLPSAVSVATVQDNFEQKQALAARGVPVPRFAAVASVAEAVDVAASLGWPVVLKARRDGYDGKGNVTVRAADQMAEAWQALGGDRGRLLMVEAFCPFVAELAIIVTRSRTGETVSYPVVEMPVQEDHICRIVRAPAPMGAEVTARVQAIASQALDAVRAVMNGQRKHMNISNPLVLRSLARPIPLLWRR